MMILYRISSGDPLLISQCSTAVKVVFVLQSLSVVLLLSVGYFSIYTFLELLHPYSSWNGIWALFPMLPLYAGIRFLMLMVADQLTIQKAKKYWNIQGVRITALAFIVLGGTLGIGVSLQLEREVLNASVTTYRNQLLQHYKNKTNEQLKSQKQEWEKELILLEEQHAVSHTGFSTPIQQHLCEWEAFLSGLNADMRFYEEKVIHSPFFLHRLHVLLSDVSYFGWTCFQTMLLFIFPILLQWIIPQNYYHKVFSTSKEIIDRHTSTSKTEVRRRLSTNTTMHSYQRKEADQ